MVSPVVRLESTQHDLVGEASRNENPVGLSERDAIANLDRDGYNELPSAQSRGILSIAWDSIQDPIFLLLVGGAIIYWILGDLQEALILLGFVVFLTAISLYQEGKTEHALEALPDLSSPRALVIRDGKRKRIAGREVVRDDILMLAEGDRGGILIHFGQGHDSKYGEETIAAIPKNGVNIMDRGFCKLEIIKNLIQDKERYFVLRIKNDMRRADAR